MVEVAAITDGQTSEAPLESLAAMSLRFEGGTIGTMSCSSRLPDSRNDVTIYGSDGRIVLNEASIPTLAGDLEVTSPACPASYSYI